MTANRGNLATILDVNVPQPPSHAPPRSYCLTLWHLLACPGYEPIRRKTSEEWGRSGEARPSGFGG